jgi:hypothetical protein
MGLGDVILPSFMFDGPGWGAGATQTLELLENIVSAINLEVGSGFFARSLIVMFSSILPLFFIALYCPKMLCDVVGVLGAVCLSMLLVIFLPLLVPQQPTEPVGRVILFAEQSGEDSSKLASAHLALRQQGMETPNTRGKYLLKEKYLVIVDPPTLSLTHFTTTMREQDAST